MPGIHVDIRRGAIFFRFDCRGVASLEGYSDVIECVRVTMASADPVRKVLVDLSGVEGQLPEMQKYTLGEVIASRLLGLRIGVVLNRNAPLTRFGENTAVNRGADLMVGYDVDQILAWLVLPVPAGANAGLPDLPA